MQVAELIKAIAAALWPVVVGGVVLVLLPIVRKMLADSNSVDIEIAGNRIGIQRASDETRKLIEDLQDRINTLEANAASALPPPGTRDFGPPAWLPPGPPPVRPPGFPADLSTAFSGRAPAGVPVGPAATPAGPPPGLPVGYPQSLPDEAPVAGGPVVGSPAAIPAGPLPGPPADPPYVPPVSPPAGFPAAAPYGSPVARSAGSGTRYRTARKKLLLVDDGPDANVFERARAVEAGYSVMQADSTDKALRLLKSDGPMTLVVSDVSRVEPDGTRNSRAGLDLVQAMRATGDQTPVILYSEEGSLAPVEPLLAGMPGVTYTASPSRLAGLIEG
jgi:hypothetical protein